jgi:hypothetical protein
VPWCPRDLKGSSSLELTNLSLPADPGLLDSWIHPSRLTLLVLLRIFLESPAASLQHTCAARPVGQLNKQFALTLIKTTKHLFTSYPCAGPPCHPATTCVSAAIARCLFPKIQPGRQREAHSRSRLSVSLWGKTPLQAATRLHPSYVQTQVAGIAQYSPTPHLLSILSYSAILISHFASSAPAFTFVFPLHLC